MGITISHIFRWFWWTSEGTMDEMDDTDLETGHWLDSYQKIILRAAWRSMGSKSTINSGGKAILKRLVLKDPGVRDVFGGFSVINKSVVTQPSAMTTFGSDGHNARDLTSFDNHGIYFADFFKFLMENLDHPDTIAMRCESIGRSHRRAKPLGFKTDFWDHFGEAVIETVREYHGWRRHRQAVAATNILLSFVVDRLRAGFLQRQEISTWAKTPYPSIDTTGIIELNASPQQRRRKSVISKTISDSGYNRMISMEEKGNNYKETKKEVRRATIARSQSEGPLQLRCKRLLPAIPIHENQGENPLAPWSSSSRGRLATTSSIRSDTRFATSSVTMPSDTFLNSSRMILLRIETSEIIFTDV